MAPRRPKKIRPLGDEQPGEDEGRAEARARSPATIPPAEPEPKAASKKPDPEREITEGSRAAEEPEVLDPEALLGEEDAEESFEEDEDEDSGPVVDVVPSSTSSLATSVAASVASTPAIAGSAGYARAQDALHQFLSQVGRYPLLTLEEEQALTNAVYERQDPIAAKKLVVHNLRLVVKMAYKYRRAWANVLDLVQEGNIGLIEAVRRFDPFKGARFSTYAAYWIRAYMIRYLLEHSRMVRISRTRAGRKLFFRLSRERERLRALGVEPGPKLLAERLGVSEEDFEEVVKHMDQPEVRLDAPLSYDGESGDTVLDTLHSETVSPERAAERSEFSDDVGRSLEHFAKTLKDPREKAAWDEHLMSEDPVPLSVLGERFGVTKQRMGQIVMALRKRLKDHLVRELGPDVQLDYSVDVE
ncbi:MAG: sigma-70 family RNA polymerase sigma factor [Myxococcota bacterium]